MKKNLSQILIQKTREITPLPLRRCFGPFIGYCSYFLNLYCKDTNNKIKVLTIKDTIDLIKKDSLSVIRFGDGEISLIENVDLGFQTKNSALASKLKNILASNIDGLLICVPGIFDRIENFTKVSFWFAIHHLFKYGQLWTAILSPFQIYGDAFITRPYLTFIDKSNSEGNFKKLFSIWENKNVVLIEGEKSRLGVGNDMFDNVTSLKRILCPAENAFSKYTEIKKEALKIDKESLVLISLGPTAKVLAYDMFLLGYRVIDIGHIDMEYEMFLRNEDHLVKVPCKYFNEINERNPEECLDEKYLSEILVKII